MCFIKKMIARYRSYNRTAKLMCKNQLIILFIQIISIIFSIIYYLIKHYFFELTIANIISFVFFLIAFIIDFTTNYNFTGKKILKLIPNIICLFFSGFFLLYVFIDGMSFCTFGCTRQHPLNIIHGITLLYLIGFGLNYVTTGIKECIISIYKNKNKNRNNENFVEDNNNTILTPNDVNENIIGSDTSQN